MDNGNLGIGLRQGVLTITGHTKSETKGTVKVNANRRRNKG